MKPNPGYWIKCFQNYCVINTYLVKEKLNSACELDFKTVSCTSGLKEIPTNKSSVVRSKLISINLPLDLLWLETGAPFLHLSFDLLRFRA